MDDSDSYGVEMALQLVDAAGGGEVSLVSMAPNGEVSGSAHGAGDGRRARGAGVRPRAVRLRRADDGQGDRRGGAAAGRRRPRLAGTESSDGYTGTVPEQVAELLGWPSVTFAKSVARRRRDVEGQPPDRGRVRRGRVPAAGGGVGDGGRRRAPLPVVQGDHGRQVEAARHGHCRRPRRDARSAGPVPASRSSTSPRRRRVRRARSWSTRARRTSRWSSSSRA